MTWNFTSFSVVLQLYQDTGKVIMIMKGCVEWNLVYDRKDIHLRWGLNQGSLDQ